MVTDTFIMNGVETIAAWLTSTALSLSVTTHFITADAGWDIFTLAAWKIGQVMVIYTNSATWVATITPAWLIGWTSITFNAAWDSVILFYTANGWVIIGWNSYAIV